MRNKELLTNHKEAIQATSLLRDSKQYLEQLTQHQTQMALTDPRSLRDSNC